MSIKIPLYADYINHTGLHYHLLWKELDDTWTCPACNRTKFQILRWTKRFPNSPNPFFDWVATLTKHHDHSVSRYGNMLPRFPETIICGQCDGSDGAVKKRLKLPKKFSFSPEEIRGFGSPHTGGVFDQTPSGNL
ncbi:MAG: hypothetical protein HQL54_12540 [Magnetococcales bacterium]|nr:hypothetical protein [Magnetococcales bacterium]